MNLRKNLYNLSILLILMSILGCAAKSPFMVVKYTQEGTPIILEKIISGRQPDWAPNENKIAYVDDGIWISDPNGENSQEISSSGKNPCFSPDGKMLLFEKQDGIWLTELSTLQSRKLIDKGKQPAWAPDGKKIAYVNNGILLWNMNQNKSTPLLPNGVNPAWAPSGKSLYFEALNPDQLNFSIWEYNLKSQKLIQIVSNAIQPTVSKDGNYMLYSSQGIWLYNITENKFIRLTAYGYDPVYSPDGNKILFSFDEDLWIMDAPYPGRKG